MRRWERPYSLDPTSAKAMLGLFGYCGLFAFPGHRLLTDGAPAALLAPYLCAVTAGAVVGVRATMRGVYVGDPGIRSRSLLRTTTAPWSSVRAISSGTGTFAGLDMGRAAIMIERLDGPAVQTPVQCGRRRLRPFALDLRPELGRIATGPAHYDDILTSLQAHHAAWRREHLGPPAAPTTVPAPVPALRKPDAARELHLLERLRERGAVTDAEYDRRRAALTDQP